MDYRKIQIKDTDTVREILDVIHDTPGSKIILFFPKDFPILSEVGFLKKMKSTAMDAGKRLIIITEKKFIRKSIEQQKIDTFAKVPTEYEAGDVRTIHAERSEDDEVEDVTKESSEPEKISGKSPFAKSKIHPTITPSNITRAKAFFAILTAVMMIIFVWFWNRPRVQIVIKPKLSAVPVIQNVLITLPEAEITVENEQLPKVKGIFVQTTIEDTEIVPTSGRTYEVTNAKGKLTLYNETDKPKFLVPSRLEAPGDVIVRFKREVTIPPKVGGEAGQVVVEVEADSFDPDGNPIGLKGNLDAGTELIFPALREDLHEVYYARMNKGPLVGGSTLIHYHVVPEDEENSQKTLLENFRDRGIQELTGEVERRSRREGGNQVLLENRELLTSEIQEFHFPTERIGEETQTIEVNGKVSVSGIVFDQAAVKEILREQMKKSLDDRQKIVTIDERSIEYQVLDMEQFEDNQVIKLSVRVVGIEQLNINSNEPKIATWREGLKKKIRGKSLDEAKGILINVPEIENVFSVQTSPFWNKSIPDETTAISFVMQAE